MKAISSEIVGFLTHIGGWPTRDGNKEGLKLNVVRRSAKEQGADLVVEH